MSLVKLTSPADIWLHAYTARQTKHSFFAMPVDYGYKDCHWTTGLERKNWRKKGNAK